MWVGGPKPKEMRAGVRDATRIAPALRASAELLFVPEPKIEGELPEPLAEGSARFLGWAEDALQVLVGAILVFAAGIVLVEVTYHLLTDLDKGASKAVAESVKGLLTVFILLELLAGLRATLVRRKLVAEPFLVVGIIASIRGIIIVALESKTQTGTQLDEAMMQIAVLGGLAVVLSVSAFVIRRKEREPTET
jgi:uncharacterized membrane protein (DUF373 family)